MSIDYRQLVAFAETRSASMTEQYKQEVHWLHQEGEWLLGENHKYLEKMFPLKRKDSFVIFNEEKQKFEPNLRTIGEYIKKISKCQ